MRRLYNTEQQCMNVSAQYIQQHNISTVLNGSQDCQHKVSNIQQKTVTLQTVTSPHLTLTVSADISVYLSTKCYVSF
jgi:hypothetical protein